MTTEGWGSDDHFRIALPVPVLQHRDVIRVWLRVYFFADLETVSTGQRMASMNDLHLLIEQMAFEITQRAERLDDSRLSMFLDWFDAHAGRQENGEEHLQIRIQEFLRSIPVQALLREYALMRSEIDWWHKFVSVIQEE
jgi:hypothetical protein